MWHNHRHSPTLILSLDSHDLLRLGTTCLCTIRTYVYVYASQFLLTERVDPACMCQSTVGNGTYVHGACECTCMCLCVLQPVCCVWGLCGCVVWWMGGWVGGCKLWVPLCVCYMYLCVCDTFSDELSDATELNTLKISMWLCTR